MHYDTTSKESTDPNPTNSTSDESAPFVCTREDCFAVLPTEGARRSHEERDHAEGGA